MEPHDVDHAPDRRTFDAIHRDDRAHILELATRWLGDRSAAEDVTQEAFSRLALVGVDEIDDARGWLAVVARRLCLDRLRSAHGRRESVSAVAIDAIGATDPLFPSAADDPADRVTLDDQIQRALAIVLDRLSPAERTAFVLHDVFGFTYGAIAEIVGRSEAACRQLASRARRSIRSSPPDAVDRSAVPQDDEHRLVVERFIAACAGGDLAELMAVLDPAVVGDAVLLGHGPIVSLEGRPFVAERLLAMFGPRADRVLVALEVDGHPGMVAFADDHVLAVLKVDIVDGLVREIHSYVRLPG